jgi:hypothetical protein
MVSPVLLGTGKRIFDGVSGKKVLELAHATTFNGGNLMLTYRAATS